MPPTSEDGSFLTLLLWYLVPATTQGALLTTIVLLVIGFWLLSGAKDLPPGPRGLPGLGYIPFLGRRPEISFASLSKKYGSIVSVYLGSRLVVVLNDYSAIKEAFLKQSKIFSGRPDDFNMSAAPKDFYSVLLVDGPVWKTHRRFAMSLLKDFGMGTKNSMEPLIMSEVTFCMKQIEKYKGKPTNFMELLITSMANTVTLMVLGRRFDYNHPMILQFIRFMELFGEGGSAVAIFSFFPWARYVPGILRITGQAKLVKAETEFNSSLKELIEEYKQRHAEGTNDCYVNAFLTEQKQRLREAPQDDLFQDLALVQNAKIIMIAGTETTASTVAWIVIYLSKYPDVFRKLQQEVDREIGQDRTPSYDYRQRTPYTEAVINEVQRITTIVPLAAPHRNLEECNVQGYRIPKDTYVVPNLWNVHNDPNLFEKPDQFKPERFIDPVKGEYVKSEHVITFSMGGRQCLGESFARLEIYLYVTSIAQMFDVCAPDGVDPSVEVVPGIALGPKEFLPRLIPRNMKSNFESTP